MPRVEDEAKRPCSIRVKQEDRALIQALPRKLYGDRSLGLQADPTFRPKLMALLSPETTEPDGRNSREVGGSTLARVEHIESRLAATEMFTILQKIDRVDRRLSMLEPFRGDARTDINSPSDEQSSSVPADHQTQDRKAIAAIKEHVKRLLDERWISASGERRLHTAASMERELIREHGISRERAYSFIQKAIAKYDPDNPQRRSRKKPIARRVGPEQVETMRELADRDVPRSLIARAMGCNVRTISDHIGARNKRRLRRKGV